MALIDIEYGSLASSETMNKNFLYLDDRISETSDSIMTSISSIYSNIATINARLTDLSEQVAESVTDLGLKQEDFDKKIENYRTKFVESINDMTLLPDWSKSIAISSVKNFTAPTNGYILVLPATTTVGNWTVNGTTLVFKTRVNNYDNSSQLVSFPVKSGDIVSSNCIMSYAYFLPVVNLVLEEDS